LKKVSYLISVSADAAVAECFKRVDLVDVCGLPQFAKRSLMLRVQLDFISLGEGKPHKKIKT
jgi:hypothetical protein